MKKSKMKLNELKVKSFTTEIEENAQNNAKGGTDVVLNTRPMCGLISIFFVCNIADPLHTWHAECP
ncbi:hypothetical protein C900_00832 [Fulvivirga imtechensis AK7]|uniref:Uncharacterized protein n=1 Tax=Fulvivirga imtechensis AK7 TaxID=1237149 RepID=L8JV34_9BACT|nr:pinensin family lanthipeptide [Fulvivirga imtechensis]ELR72871.1 hypothetical protein C900_00832 [Fulvivirga imtechensis AK7]